MHRVDQQRSMSKFLSNRSRYTDLELVCCITAVARIVLQLAFPFIYQGGHKYTNKRESSPELWSMTLGYCREGSCQTVRCRV